MKTASSIKMDLGIGDVHVPGPIHARPAMKYECNDRLECADDCSKAMTRLNAARECGDVDDAEFSAHKAKIEEAAKKFSVHVPTAAVITPEMRECSLHGEVVDLVTMGVDEEPGKLVWVQVAKQGKFRGHAAGPFEMTLGTFEEIIRNFRNSQNKTIPFDFEHASEQEPTEGSIPSEGAPAQGWIHDLKIGEDGNLWGLTEWLPLARKYIKNKQYKFLSPAIVFGAKDRVTGKPIGARLSSVALTNNPFLDGMAPLAAKHRESAALASASADAIARDVAAALRRPDILETVRLSLGGTPNNQKGTGASMGDRPLNEENNMSELEKKVAELSTQLSETKVNLSQREAQVSETEKKLTLTQEKLQTTEAKVAEVTLALNESAAKLTAADEEIKTLRAWKEEQEKATFDARLTEAFDTYKEARKLTDQDKEMMSVYLKANPAGFEQRFPKVTADKRHLLRTVTPEDKTTKKEGTSVPGEGGKLVNLADAALALSRQKGIPLDQAQRIVINRSSKKGA